MLVMLNTSQGPALDLVGWLSGKEPACQCRRGRFDSWVGKLPWRRKWQATPVILPGESRGQQSLAVYSPWGRTESDTPERRGTYALKGVKV